MQELYFHTFQITIIATADSCFDAWIGAFVRANFLSAAESIVVEPQGKTLRNIISGEASDSLRGFAFSFPADAQPTICLNSTQAISFEIHLIGCISNYYLKIIQALQAMCNKGMGHPPKRFILQTVEEISFDGKKNLLFADDKLCAKTLLFPITYSDYLKKYGAIAECKTVEICFDRPVQPLFRIEYKKQPDISYQDKLNGFPSLYSLVKKVINRAGELNILYCNGKNKTELSAYDLQCVSAFILEDCRLQTCRDYCDTPSKPEDSLTKNYNKNHDGNVLSGFTGTQCYRRTLKPAQLLFSSFFPLLKMFEELGVNNRAIYGLDKYKIDVKY